MVGSLVETLEADITADTELFLTEIFEHIKIPLI